MHLNIILLDTSYFDLLWSNNSLTAQLIILIIVGLLGVTAYVFWRQWNRFNSEEQGLRRVQNNLSSWRLGIAENDDEELVKDDEDLQVLHQAPIPLLQEGVRPDLIIYDRLDTLQENKITRSRINVGVLQNLALLKENKEWTANFPKYVMTLAMLLGMLGTFIGLTVMVGEISESLKSIGQQSGSASNFQEFSSSFDSIRNTLGGVGTAFSTTLAGLACTIMASFMNYLISQRRAKFFNQLEQFTVQELLPYTFPNLEEKSMLETIEDQLEDSFINLKETIDLNNNSLGELNGLYKKFDSIEDTLRGVLSSGGASEIQGVIRELTTVNTSLKDMINKYQNEQLLEDFRNLTGHHHKYVNSLNGILTESKWIPTTKTFLVAIAGFLFLITVFLGIGLLQ